MIMKNKLILFLITLIIATSFSCSFNKKKPAGPTGIKTYTFAKKYVVKEGKADNLLNISISVQFPETFGNDSVLKKARKIVLDDYFPDTDNSELNADSSINKYVKTYYTFFKNTELDNSMIDEEYNSNDEPWYQNGVMGINYNKNGIFSYTITLSSYTGGAHGGTTITNGIIDMANGKKLTEKDIFKTGSYPVIKDMIISKILKKNRVETKEDLYEIGYFNIDDIKLNGNFFVNEKGITYTFNEYEIASYAVGSTDIILSFKELSNYMIPGNPFSFFYK